MPASSGDRKQAPNATSSLAPAPRGQFVIRELPCCCPAAVRVCSRRGLAFTHAFCERQTLAGHSDPCTRSSFPQSSSKPALVLTTDSSSLVARRSERGMSFGGGRQYCTGLLRALAVGLYARQVAARTFTVTNNCPFTIWYCHSIFYVTFSCILSAGRCSRRPAVSDIRFERID